MSKLINLDELLKFPIRIDHYDKVNGDERYVLGIEAVLDYAKNLPTIQQPEWISCAERLPDNIGNVLALLRFGKESRVYLAYYANGEWWDCVFNTPTTETTTHWMPLPQPPKEGE